MLPVCSWLSRTFSCRGASCYSHVWYFLVLSGPRQVITFHSSPFDALSDPKATAVIAHEPPLAWPKEHVRPEESKEGEREGDTLARGRGFGPELDARDRETAMVHSD